MGCASNREIITPNIDRLAAEGMMFDNFFLRLARMLAGAGSLIICDEWGYIPLDRTGTQLLFEVISECYERKTLIINTNLEFSKWVNVFYDEQMTGAILDRVLHHCHLLLFPGPSNRMRESGLSN